MCGNLYVSLLSPWMEEIYMRQAGEQARQQVEFVLQGLGSSGWKHKTITSITEEPLGGTAV